MNYESIEANSVIHYMKEKFNVEPEFLWAKTPGNAIFRRKDNSKWFAALLNIPKQKLGISDDDNVDILDLKCDPILIGSLIDRKRYFPAYHMNKEHWITILLDGSVALDEIFNLIELSHEMSIK